MTAAPVSLKDQQAELAAEPELDFIGKAYQQEIEQCRQELDEATAAEEQAHDNLLDLKARLRKLNRKFQEHCDEMKP